MNFEIFIIDQHAGQLNKMSKKLIEMSTLPTLKIIIRYILK